MKNSLIGLIVVLTVLASCNWKKDVKIHNKSDVSSISKRNSETKHLKLLDEKIVIPAVSKFDPWTYFFHNQEGVGYGYDPSFKHIVKHCSSFCLPEITLPRYILKESTYDNDIISELKIKPDKILTKEKILWTIAYLTKLQSRGQDGTLLTKNYDATIIGYLLCDDKIVRAVFVCWRAELQRWICNCFSLDKWYVGYEVININ